MPAGWRHQRQPHRNPVERFAQHHDDGDGSSASSRAAQGAGSHPVMAMSTLDRRPDVDVRSPGSADEAVLRRIEIGGAESPNGRVGLVGSRACTRASGASGPTCAIGARSVRPTAGSDLVGGARRPPPARPPRVRPRARRCRRQAVRPGRRLDEHRRPGPGSHARASRNLSAAESRRPPRTVPPPHPCRACVATAAPPAVRDRAPVREPSSSARARSSRESSPLVALAPVR